MSIDFLKRRQSLSTTLLASAVQLATGNNQPVSGNGVMILDAPNSVLLELDVTAGGVGSGDTLNVYVQTRIDGVNWVDVAAFSQVLGNAAVKRFYVTLNASQAMTAFENASVLSAGSTRNLIGNDWAVRWVIAGSGPPTFTFSVTTTPQ